MSKKESIQQQQVPAKQAQQQAQQPKKEEAKGQQPPKPTTNQKEQSKPPVDPRASVQQKQVDQPKGQPGQKDQQQKTSQQPSRPKSVSPKKTDLEEVHREQAKQYQLKYFQKLQKELDEDFLLNSTKQVQQKDEKIINNLTNGKLFVEGNIFRKANVIEEAVIDKKLKDADKYKRDLQKELQQLQAHMNNLQSQKIDNPKSIYSHPVLKGLVLEEERKRRQAAKRLIKQLKKEKLEFKRMMKEKEEELMRKEQEQENKKKQADVELQTQIKKQKEEKIQRDHRQLLQYQKERKQNQQHEEKYKEKRKKNDKTSVPLYKKIERQYLMEMQKELKNKKQQYNEIFQKFNKDFKVADYNFSEHQEKYQEELKRCLEERKKKREEFMEDLQKKNPDAKIDFLSNKWLQNELEMKQQENFKDKKAIEKQKAEQRKIFSQDIQKSIMNCVQQDPEKELELQVQIDKRKNPLKYIKRVRVRKSDKDTASGDEQKYKELNAVDLKKKYLDEDIKIYKQEAPMAIQITETGKHKDKGDQYFKELKEKVNQYVKSKSEQQMAKLDDVDENNQFPENDTIQTRKSVPSELPAINQKLKPEQKKLNKLPDYLDEVRKKFKLSDLNKKNSQWDSFLTDPMLNPYEKQRYQMRMAEKIEEDAKKQEALFKYQRKHPELMSQEESKKREDIDNLYYKSIKAKLKMLSGDDDKNSNNNANSVVVNSNNNLNTNNQMQ